MEVEYIIVGQGIAGSMVAHFLLSQNKKIVIIDKFEPNSSSNIAAGVVNPITGRRMVKTWLIDDILPFAKQVYHQLEQELNTSFFFEQEIVKLFPAAEDRQLWERKKSNPEFGEYLGDIIEKVGERIQSPFGAGIIRQAGWMDVPKFIHAYRSFLRGRNSLLEEKAELDKIIITDHIQYKHIKAQKIIFCEGFRAIQNPLFDFVPFTIAKGEQFLVQIPGLNVQKILNKNIYLIPKGEDTYNIGSSFIWDDLEETVTDAGRTGILDKLRRMVSAPFSILEEKAGIRPTVKDRRPVIGPHPDHKNIYIFNGMGTKGVSLAPYFANQFVNYLENGFSLTEEVLASRFAVNKQ